MSGEVARLFVDVGGDVNAAIREIRTLDQIIGNMGRSVAATGAGMTAAISLPLAGIGGLAMAASTQFESSFAGVRKTVEFTRSELNQLGHATGDFAADTEAAFGTLSNSLRDMAKTKPIDVNEINAIAEAAGALGVKATDIRAFTDVVADMGVTTNMTSSMAGDMMARFANVSGLAAKGSVEWDRMGATIVDLGNKTAATELEIMKMGVRIAGAGTIVGLAAHQTMSFAATLASVGIRAEAGGSSISTAMIKMSQHVHAGGEALNTLARTAGMTAAEFKYAFLNDAASAIGSFTQGLARMDAASDQTFAKVQQLVKGGMSVEQAFDAVGESGENVFNVLKSVGLADIRVRNAMLALGNSGDLLSNTLATGASAWQNNSALAVEAGKRYATVESQIHLLRNRVYDVAITFGNAMRPALMVVMQALNSLTLIVGNAVNAFAALPAPVRTAITLFVAGVAAAGPLIAGFGLFLTAVGSLLSPLGLLSVLVSALGGVFVANIGNIQGIANAFLVNSGIAQAFANVMKFVMTTVQMTANNLAGGIDPLTSLLYGLSGASNDFWGTFWRLVPLFEAVRSGMSFVGNVVEAVTQTFRAMSSGMSPLNAVFYGLAVSGLVPISSLGKLLDVVRTVQGVFATVWSVVGPIVTTAANIISQAIGFVVNNFGWLAGSITGGLGAFLAVTPIMSIVTSVMGILAPIVTAIGGAFGVLVGMVSGGIGVFGSLAAIIGGLGAFISALVTDIALYGVGAFASLAATNAWAAGMGIVTPIIQGVVGALGLLFSPMFLFVATAAIIAAAWQTNASQIIAVAMTLVNIMATIGAMMGPVWAFAFSQILVAAQTAFGFVPQIASMALSHLQSLASMIGGVLIAAFAAVAPVIVMAFGMLPSLISAFMPMLGSIINLVGSVLVGAFSSIAPIAIGVFQGVSSAVMAVLPVIVSLATTIMSGLHTVFATLAPIASGAFAQLASATTIIGPIIAAVGSSIGNSLAGAISVVIPYAQSLFTNIAALASMAGPVIVGLAGIIGSFLVTAIAALAPVVHMAFGFIPQIVAAAMPVLAALGSIVMSVGSIIFSALGYAVQFVQSNWSAFAGVISVVAGVFGSIIGIVGGGVVGAFNILNSVIGLVSSVVANLSNYFSFAFSQVGPALQPIIPAFQSLASVIGSQVIPGLISAANNIAGFLIPILQGLAMVVGGLVGGAFITLVSFVAGAIPGVANIVSGVFGIIVGIFHTFIGVVQLIGAVLNAIFIGDIPSALGLASLAFQNIFSGIGNIILGAIQVIGGAVRAIAGGIISVFQNLYMVLVGGSIVPETISAIVGLFTNFNLGPLADAALKGVIAAFSNLSTVLPDLASKAWGAVSGVITSAGGVLGGIVKNITGQQSDAFATGSAGLPDAAESAWGQVEAQFASQAPNIAAQTMQVAQAATEAWSSSLMSLADVTIVVWSSVSETTATATSVVLTTTTNAGVETANAWLMSTSTMVEVTTLGWTSILSLTITALTTLMDMQLAYTTAWASLSLATWTNEVSLWTEAWTMLSALTTISWTNVVTTWITGWTTVVATDTAAWTMLTITWMTQWALLSSTTLSSITSIVSTWASGWQMIIAADAASWATILMAWDTAHTTMHDSTHATIMMIGQGFATASAMFAASSEVVIGRVGAMKTAMDDLKDAAREAAEALAAVGAAGSAVEFAPEITPGSPPPIAYAMWDIASSANEASDALIRLGSSGQIDIEVQFSGGRQEEIGALNSQSTILDAVGGRIQEVSVVVQDVAIGLHGIQEQISGIQLDPNIISLEPVAPLDDFGSRLQEPLQSARDGVQDALRTFQDVIELLRLLSSYSDSGIQFTDALEDSAERLAEAAVSLGGIWARAAKGFENVANDGSKPMSDTLSESVGAYQSVISILQTLSSFGEHPVSLTETMKADAETLSEHARSLAGIWADASKGFDALANDGTKSTSDTLSSALSGYESVIGILAILSSFSKEPIQYTLEMQTAAEDLASYASSLAAIWSSAASSFTEADTAGAKPMGDALQGAISGFEAVIGILKSLSSYVGEQIELTETMLSSAETLSGHAVTLAEIWADASRGFELVANNGTAPMGDTLQSAVSGFDGVIGVMRVLSDYSTRPVELTSDMKRAAEDLATHATSLAEIWANAAKGFELIANSGTGPMSDTLVSAISGFEGVIGVLRVLEDYSRQPVELTSGMKRAAEDLATHATSLAEIWANASRGFDLISNNGTAPMSDTLQSAISGFEGVIGVLRVLENYANQPVQMTEDMQKAAEDLSQHATTLAEIWAKASKGFDLIANNGTGPMSDTLSSAVSGFDGVIGVLRLLETYATQPVHMTEDIKRAAEELAEHATTLAEIWAKAAKGFDLVANNGTGPMGDTLQSAISGFEGVIGVMKVLASYVKEPVEMTEDMKQAAEDLVTHAVSLATIWANASKGFDLIANSGTGPMSDTLQSAISGFEGVIGVMKVLASYVKEPVEMTEDMKQAAEDLAEHARSLAEIWAKAAAGFDMISNSGTEPMSTTLNSGVDGFNGVIGILKSLSLFVKEPISLTQDIKDEAKKLAEAARFLADEWATASEGFDMALDGGVGQMSDTLKSGVDGFVSVIEIIKVLAVWSQEPVTLTEDMKGAATTLATHAFSLAEIWATASEGFDMIAHDGVAAMADTVSSMAGGLDGIIGAMKSLVSFGNDPIPLTQTMKDNAKKLAENARDLGTIWSEVALNFDTVTNSGVSSLTNTITSMSDGIASTIGALNVLTSYGREPIVLTDRMKDNARNLANAGRELGEIWATVALNFDTISNAGVSALSDTISSANSGIGSVISLLNVFVSLADDPVVIVANIGSAMYELASQAYTLAEIFADVASGFDTVTHDGVSALASAIGDAQSSIASVIGIMDAIATFQARPPDLADDWVDFAESILDDARTIADALSEAARGFDEIAGQQARAMADAAASAFDIIASALSTIPDIANFLGGYISLTPGIRAQLVTLVTDIVAVFDAFAQAALEADITQAATDAAAALADGFNSAIDAIKGAFELFKMLLGGNAPHLGFNMVSPQVVSDMLDPYFDFIELVVTEFSNRASSYNATDMSAAMDLSGAVGAVFEAIKSVFDAIEAFQGINAPQYAGGSSGVSNISAVLTHIFTIFDNFSDRGASVQNVANALSAAVGAILLITNALSTLPSDVNAVEIEQIIEAIVNALAPVAANLGSAGFEMGITLGEGIADGLLSQKDVIVAALNEIIESMNMATGKGVGKLIPAGSGTPGSGNTSGNDRNNAGGGGDIYYITKTYNLTQNVDKSTAIASAQSFQQMEAMS